MKIYKNVRTGDLTIMLENKEDITVAIIHDNGKYERPRYVCRIADTKNEVLLPYPSNECILDKTEDILCELVEKGILKKKRKERK